MTKRKMAYVVLGENCVCIAVYDDRTKAIAWLENNGVLREPEDSDPDHWIGRVPEDDYNFWGGEYVWIETLPINGLRDYRA